MKAIACAAVTLLGIALCVCLVHTTGTIEQPHTASGLIGTYGSAPKGLVLEGTAEGIEAVQSISYDTGNHRFVINRTNYYNIPVNRERLVAILEALGRDDRLGVSYTPSGRVIIYGKIDKNDPAVQTLAHADRILVSVVFGWEKNLRNVALPGDWQPRGTLERRQPVVCVNIMNGYRFTLAGDTYHRTGLSMSNLLLPMAGGTAGDGGFLATDDKAHIEPNDQYNLDFLRANAREFLTIPQLKDAADIGEVAALARYLRESGNLDLRKLANHVKTAK